MVKHKTTTNAIESILGFTGSILEKFRSRYPGSTDSIKASEYIVQYLKGFCDEAYSETFVMHPGSLFSVCKIIGIVYIISILLLIAGGVFIYIAAALCLLSFVYAFIHFFLYGSVFDFLFKGRPGSNAIGILEPEGGAKKQVIVCGHHDSAYVFSFFSKFERLAGLRLIIAMLFFIYMILLTVISSFHSAFGGFSPVLTGMTLILSLAGLLFIVPLIFFISGKVSPGAGDNLIGSSIAAHATQYFKIKRNLSEGLKNTRLIVLSTDGEEAGQRGAIDYAKRHINELKEIPSYVINTDSIYKKDFLAVMKRDRHGFVKLSGKLSDICMKTSSDLGYEIKEITIPFGSGTDAAAFAKAGIDAVSIIAMSTSLFDEGHTYHTLNDTVEAIEPEAVEAVFDIVTSMIKYIDDKGL